MSPLLPLAAPMRSDLVPGHRMRLRPPSPRVLLRSPSSRSGRMHRSHEIPGTAGAARCCSRDLHRELLPWQHLRTPVKASTAARAALGIIRLPRRGAALRRNAVQPSILPVDHRVQRESSKRSSPLLTFTTNKFTLAARRFLAFLWSPERTSM